MDINEILQNKEEYNSLVDNTTKLLLSILEKGEVTEIENEELELLMSQEIEEYNSILQSSSTIDTKKELSKEEFINILTDNGRKTVFSIDDDDNITIDGTAIPELTVLVNKLNLIATGGDGETQLSLTPDFVSLMATDLDDTIQAKLEITKNSILQTVSATYATSDEVEEYRSEAEQLATKFGWLVKSGYSESTMELTDRLYSLITEKVMINAKNIELNGSININYGSFKVSTTGNTQIGGYSAVYADGYLRAQCEITSNGTIYSCSSSRSNEYTKITEGRVSVYTGGYFTFIGANGIKTNDELVLACDNMLLDYNDNSPGRIRFRRSSGNYYFDPHYNNAVRLGSSTYYWNVVYAAGGVNTGSDRTLKENIEYLNDENNYNFYDFIRNDYVLAKYNYLEDDKTKISAIAQDVIVNADGTDNILGQLIVDCEGTYESNGKLNMNQTQLLNITIGAMQQIMKKIENLEERINGSN